ncbi:twin-arginine translocase subunit TatB [Thermosulfurimonas marina]|uniref:Twin-arginine translocase subunit TatB n=1 Tax=Thermosulfurimonas marina TaxID=2047767 RepID=A0A6H1WUQ1_9BACT|nr:Sec-independent protein translocase protein TatB [Thermosulfurimonas marina]QJA06884.1 twin-arginine translocase subunit TatB [Thermosulfurimonas marina]
MFNIGFPELVTILVVALLVLGPEKLPEVGRAMARLVVEFRRATEELKRELGVDELEEAREEIRSLADPLKEPSAKEEKEDASPQGSPSATP